MRKNLPIFLFMVTPPLCASHSRDFFPLDGLLQKIFSSVPITERRGRAPPRLLKGLLKSVSLQPRLDGDRLASPFLHLSFLSQTGGKPIRVKNQRRVSALMRNPWVVVSLGLAAVTLVSGAIYLGKLINKPAPHANVAMRPGPERDGPEDPSSDPETLVVAMRLWPDMDGSGDPSSDSETSVNASEVSACSQHSKRASTLQNNTNSAASVDFRPRSERYFLSPTAAVSRPQASLSDTETSIDKNSRKNSLISKQGVQDSRPLDPESGAAHEVPPTLKARTVSGKKAPLTPGALHQAGTPAWRSESYFLSPLGSFEAISSPSSGPPNYESMRNVKTSAKQRYSGGDRMPIHSRSNPAASEPPVETGWNLVSPFVSPIAMVEAISSPSSGPPNYESMRNVKTPAKQRYSGGERMPIHSRSNPVASDPLVETGWDLGSPFVSPIAIVGAISSPSSESPSHFSASIASTMLDEPEVTGSLIQGRSVQN